MGAGEGSCPLCSFITFAKLHFHWGSLKVPAEAKSSCTLEIYSTKAYTQIALLRLSLVPHMLCK